MKNRDLILAGVIAIAVLLNIAIFYMAYPAVFQASLPRGNQVGHDGNFSMPFSAYYEGAWRVIHDPANVYSRQNSSSDYPLRYPPQQYKYTPSFLLIMLPLVRLSYSSAFLLFDGIQLALLPVLGFFVFQLIRGKRLLLSIPASVIVLLAPLPAIPWGEYTQATVNSVASSLQFRVSEFSAQTLSWSYYWNWVHGEARGLQIALLVAAMYFGHKDKPAISAILAVIGAFDPRILLVALPLLLYYNRQNLPRFLGIAGLAFLLSTLPFLLYDGGTVMTSFIGSLVRGSARTPIYTEAWIPIYGILALTLVECYSWLKPSSSIE